MQPAGFTPVLFTKVTEYHRVCLCLFQVTKRLASDDYLMLTDANDHDVTGQAAAAITAEAAAATPYMQPLMHSESTGAALLAAVAVAAGPSACSDWQGPTASMLAEANVAKQPANILAHLAEYLSLSSEASNSSSTVLKHSLDDELPVWETSSKRRRTAGRKPRQQMVTVEQQLQLWEEKLAAAQLEGLLAHTIRNPR